ncbi:MAG: hypothetical protein HYY46_02305, partial [Deltaproteobacteria bacterium]|nr:hypothetical protein [Deltaproteobacteria bacterium]
MEKIRFAVRGSVSGWLACFVLSLALAAPALGAASYYEGKSIEVIIPYPVAGGSDVWIRT